MGPGTPLVRDVGPTLDASKVTVDAGARTPEELASIVEARASRPDEWMGQVRLRAQGRWYQRIHLAQDYDVWLISWLPGQSTGFHDHGASAGAFVVVLGFLEEHRPGEQAGALPAGASRTFGPGYTHDVRNVSPAPAISIHAYSPPLSEMNEYELDGSRLVPRDGAVRGLETIEQDWRMRTVKRTDSPGVQSVEQMLTAARGRLRRLAPHDAYEAFAKDGAVLVDIRPEAQRRLEGSVPGAVVVERNVLEWRFDPACSARLTVAANYDLPVIVFCSEGYTSSLAAAALQDLGLWRATDIVGGFEAWRGAGLPMVFNERDELPV